MPNLLTKVNSILKEVGLDIKLDKIKELSKKDNLTTEELKSFLEKNKEHFKKELERFNNGEAEKELSYKLPELDCSKMKHYLELELFF